MTLALPAAHKFVVGGMTVAVPLADPHSPLIVAGNA